MKMVNYKILHTTIWLLLVLTISLVLAAAPLKTERTKLRK